MFGPICCITPYSLTGPRRSAEVRERYVGIPENGPPRPAVGGPTEGKAVSRPECTRNRRCAVGKPLATRQDLSFKNGPDSGRPGRAKVRVSVFAELDYFLFADDTDGTRHIGGYGQTA